MNMHEYLFKAILLGEWGVGKSSMIWMYKLGVFKEREYPLIGVEFIVKNESVDGTNVCIQIWNHVSNERFR